MKYLEWNNIIAQQLFNTKNAGRDVHLYLTHKEIVEIGRKCCDNPDEEIWSDFVKCIKWGLPGSTGNIVAKTKYCFEKRMLNKIDLVEVNFPPYIAYLIFLILPLIEGMDGTYAASNYYDRLNRMLLQNKIRETIGTSDFRKNNINALWQDLEIWANTKKNGELGNFKVLPFKNVNWIYVGKFFSQCIFPPKALKELPRLFLECGFAPNLFYAKDDFKKVLLNYGARVLLLKDNVIDLIKKSETNELGQTILEIVLREYEKWTGETNEDVEAEKIHHIKRSFTVVPLFLQLKLNLNDESIAFSFRLFSSNDYPEDLKLANNDNIYEHKGWSKTLNLEFKESFEIKDDFNKWLGRFSDSDVRLFINAGKYQLSSSYWVETKFLSRTDELYLLCKNEKRNSIVEWSKSFQPGNFTEEFFEGMLNGYCIFKIINPLKSHPNIPLLTLHSEKKIELTRGLKVNFRTFINDYVPEVEISNSNGSEKVYLQYRNTNERVFLSNITKSNSWMLPQDVLLNTNFCIKVEEEKLDGNEIAYMITSADGAAQKITETQLPKRNSFGTLLNEESNQYSLGSNLINPMKSSQRYFCPWESFFIPNRYDNIEIETPVFFNHSGNKFSSFLSLKNVLTTEDFYEAFEFYFSKGFDEFSRSKNVNLTRTKRAALNFYDYTGFLDYEYESKKIVVNPPQLIFIPSNEGRKVLLIGGRDSSLIKRLIEKACRYNLRVQIKKQFSSNVFLLLPDIITLKPICEDNQFWETNLSQFASELNIKFSNGYFPQIALYEFSADITLYENSLDLMDENDYDWARKTFNPDTLRYEQNNNENFDRSFSLIEYKLNEYTYYNKLWKDDKCFHIDKNWGRYLALKHYKKNVILCDGKRKRVAVPVSTPLPRLLAESVMLFSGYVPNILKIEEQYYRVYENIPSVISNNIFWKLGQEPINKELL